MHVFQFAMARHLPHEVRAALLDIASAYARGQGIDALADRHPQWAMEQAMIILAGSASDSLDDAAEER
jgi:hypothetical protein